MKPQLVHTANIKLFWSALERVSTADRKSNRMMLAFGEPGLGKTEAAMEYMIENSHCIYVRAKAMVTPRWLLGDLVRELGEEPEYHASALFNQALTQLNNNPRMIMVDESDYLLHDPRCLETLRDLHDSSMCSVCIIGEGAMDHKLARYKHLFDRFAEVIKFTDLTLADVRNVCAAMAEVRITEDAVVFIHKNTPRFRQVKAWIKKAEHLAKVNSLKEITAAHLGARK